VTIPNSQRREQLRHDVAELLRHQILSRQLRPGDIIRLDRIAREMDVSATPVREALLMLTQDGWIVHEPNRGFRVLGFRRNDTQDIYLVWAAAEAEMAARAAGKATAADIAVLRDLDQRLRATDNDTSGDLALELNARLHSKIHEIADSPKLAWFAEAANRIVPAGMWMSFPSIPQWRVFNQSGHTSIVDRIAEGDELGASQLTRQHFMLTGDMLITWLDSRAFWESTEPLRDAAGNPTQGRFFLAAAEPDRDGTARTRLAVIAERDHLTLQHQHQEFVGPAVGADHELGRDRSAVGAGGEVGDAVLQSGQGPGLGLKLAVDALGGAVELDEPVAPGRRRPWPHLCLIPCALRTAFRTPSRTGRAASGPGRDLRGHGAEHREGGRGRAVPLHCARAGPGPGRIDRGRSHVTATTDMR
jgi:DNA-binding GntR family transcriptional regulator